MNDLLRTVLLGTDKQELNAAELPPAIQKVLIGVPPADKEDVVLKTLVLSGMYNLSGKKTMHSDLPKITLAPLETKKIADYATVDNFLTQMEIFKRTNEIKSLEDLMDEMITENKIFAPENLVSLLNALPKNINLEKKIIEKLHQIIGERGKWLLRFNKSWKYMT